MTDTIHPAALLQITSTTTSAHIGDRIVNFLAATDAALESTVAFNKAAIFPALAAAGIESCSRDTGEQRLQALKLTPMAVTNIDRVPEAPTRGDRVYETMIIDPGLLANASALRAALTERYMSTETGAVTAEA